MWLIIRGFLGLVGGGVVFVEVGWGRGCVVHGFVEGVLGWVSLVCGGWWLASSGRWRSRGSEVDVVRMAVSTGLTAYDASYVVVAGKGAEGHVQAVQVSEL